MLDFIQLFIEQNHWSFQATTEMLLSTINTWDGIFAISIALGINKNGNEKWYL